MQCCKKPLYCATTGTAAPTAATTAAPTADPGQRPSFEACVAELAKASIMLCTNSRFLAAELGSPAHKPLGPWQQHATPAGLLDAVAGIPDTGPHAVLRLREYVTQALRTAHLKQSSRVSNPHDLSVDEIGAIVLYTKEWAGAHGTSLCASPPPLSSHQMLPPHAATHHGTV